MENKTASFEKKKKKNIFDARSSFIAMMRYMSFISVSLFCARRFNPSDVYSYRVFATSRAPEY